MAKMLYLCFEMHDSASDVGVLQIYLLNPSQWEFHIW
jgi:hypothetical protein